MQTRFLEYALPTPLRLINAVTYATTVKHLASSRVSKTRVAVPTQTELQSIIAFLDRETAKIDGLVSEAEKAIELLRERRSALISAAVTGQIDVGGIIPESVA
jgi:type I restriction enzyme S subunit